MWVSLYKKLWRLLVYCQKREGKAGLPVKSLGLGLVWSSNSLIICQTNIYWAPTMCQDIVQESAIYWWTRRSVHPWWSTTNCVLLGSFLFFLTSPNGCFLICPVEPSLNLSLWVYKRLRSPASTMMSTFPCLWLHSGLSQGFQNALQNLCFHFLLGTLYLTEYCHRKLLPAKLICLHFTLHWCWKEWNQRKVVQVPQTKLPIHLQGPLALLK